MNFALFKPFGYISQFRTDARKKKLLGELYDFPEGTMAVGRLDEESEGLLILTTDGKTSERIRGREVEKEYFVQVDGNITEEAMQKIRTGVNINSEGIIFQTLPCKVEKIKPPDLPPRPKKIRGDHHGPTSWISVTLTEGKNRQVRKMTAAAGFPTLRLIRWRIGSLTIRNMQPGEVKVLEKDWDGLEI